MNTSISITLFFLIGIFTSNAQNTISGVIKDGNEQPLPFANVILYETAEKKLITGVISNESGNYIFEDLANGNYYIEVSALGFATKKSTPFVIDKDNAAKELHFSLQEDMLDEVVVTNRRPVIKQTAEKLIVDLEKSEMVNTNVQDVLKKVPGIIVRGDKINYGGQGNIRILINGKTTDYLDLASLLREMPAENISKVELIQQPGAEYDAAGSGPILNIILKRNVKLGTHGSIRSTAGYVDDFMYGTSASVASYKNKLNWQASGGVRRGSWREDLVITRKVLDETYQQVSSSPEDPLSLRLSGGLDYYISEQHKAGISINRIQSGSDRVSSNATTVIGNGSINNLFTDNSFDRDRIIFTVNPYYEFNSKKDQLSLDFNFVDYGYKNVNELFDTGNSTIAFDDQRYFQNADYKIFTYKGDYKRTVSENFNWSAGAKLSTVDSDSDLQAFAKNSAGVFVDNPNQTNRFLIDESILGVYSKFTLKHQKWSLSGGLRWEESKTEGTSMTQNQTRTRNISKFFPSASLGRAITEELGANFAYSYRIQRPSYSSLNSFMFFYDPFTFEAGNPNLSPSFTNSYRFSLTYENQPFFSVSYRQTKDQLFEIVTQDDVSAQTFRSVINLARNDNWSLQLFAPLSFIKGVDGFSGFIVNHTSSRSELLTPKLDLSKWSLTWYTSASYELPWKINSEITGYYTSGALEGQIDLDWFASIDIAFSKKFMNDRLKVAVEFEEILNRNYVGQIAYDNIDASIDNGFARQNVYLQLSYKFGSNFNKSKKRANASEDEQDRIKTNN